MNALELEMYDSLIDLKKKHHIKGIKISFEDEGLTTELAQIICSVAFKADVKVSMKIGGCEARRDIYDAKVLGVDKVVSPMVETPYALKKFVEAIHWAYDCDDLEYTKFLVNIETITGYQNLKEMIELPEFRSLYGIVLGRVDFSGSLGKNRAFVNTSEMHDYAVEMSAMVHQAGKKFFIGGGVSKDSLDFFREMGTDVPECFETRNIIFDTKTSLRDPNIDIGLAKAQGFELTWMKRKKEFYERTSNLEVKRIEMIEERYKATMARLQEGIK